MEHGIVTSVTYDDGVVGCDVQPVRNDTEYEKVPVLKPHSAFIQVPKQNEMVTMEQLDDGTRFITNVVSKTAENPDEMAEGELSIQLDKATRITFEKRTDGNFDLHLDASGDVYINGQIQ